MADPTSNQNIEIASELISAITAAANAGDALALGPQSVKNLHGLLSDLLRSVETTGCARCKEHEQFRHQHRNCDSLAVALQRIKLSAISLADAQVIALEALRGPEEPSPGHVDPFKRCQHDLCKPGTTIVVDGAYDAKCMCCLQEWHLPPVKASEPAKCAIDKTCLEYPRCRCGAVNGTTEHAG